MSVFHLAWIVPLSVLLGYFVGRLFTAVDLSRSLEYGEDFRILGMHLTFSKDSCEGTDDGQD